MRAGGSFKCSTPDRGTNERWKNSGRIFELTEDRRTLVARVADSEILDVMLEKRLINEPERQAGLRLKRNYLDAKVETRPTSIYSPRVSTSHYNDRSEAQEEAYEQWRAALMNVDIKLRNMLVNVVCQEMPVSSYYYLKCALIQLVKHYNGYGLNVDFK